MGQSVWRQSKVKRLSIKYQEENFRLSVKKPLALAFVPINGIFADFDLVAAKFDDDSEEFIDCLEKIWIDEPTKNDR